MTNKEPAKVFFFFIFSEEKDGNGGKSVLARVYQAFEDSNLKFIGTTGWNTAWYSGKNQEVCYFLEKSGIIKKDEIIRLIEL